MKSHRSLAQFLCELCYHMFAYELERVSPTKENRSLGGFYPLSRGENSSTYRRLAQAKSDLALITDPIAIASAYSLRAKTSPITARCSEKRVSPSALAKGHRLSHWKRKHFISTTSSSEGSEVIRYIVYQTLTQNICILQTYAYLNIYTNINIFRSE